MSNTHILIAALKTVHKGIAEGKVVLDAAALWAVEQALGLESTTDFKNPAQVAQVQPAQNDAVKQLTQALAGPFREDPAGGARAFTAVLPLLQAKAGEISMPIAEFQWREGERIALAGLKRLMHDFEIRVERTALTAPMTYLEEVQIICEFQPGTGHAVADAIRSAIQSKSNDSRAPAAAAIGSAEG